MDRMSALPGYQQNADADNRITFHGREVRQVRDAAGARARQHTDHQLR